MSILSRMGDAIWVPWLLGLFLLTGLWYSLCTGFFQLFGLARWLRATVGTLFSPRRDRQGGGLTQMQALSTALAATIGTGSIAGVATAIFWGGPGAVFWMWVSALLGMMTGCAEKALAVHFRVPVPGGGYRGGPMYYMERGLGSRALGALFSLACLGASLGGGSLVQSNSIATALHASFGLPAPAVGLITALLCGLVLRGGVGRIGRVSEALVPAMALLFLGSGAVCLLARREAIPSALSSILRCALLPRSALGGAAGYGVTAALRYGVARGVFTNEAGLGSSAIAHAQAEVDHPARQGMWGIFEVFAATVLVCSVTALVILTSGVYDPAAALRAIQSGTAADSMTGAPLSAAAFSVTLGRGGGVVVALCLLLFAFTSLLGWSCYGEQCLAYLLGGDRGRRSYRLLFLLTIFAGSVGDMTAVWALSDVFSGLMALPNLLALLRLTPCALALLRDFQCREEPKRTHRRRQLPPGGAVSRSSSSDKLQSPPAPRPPRRSPAGSPGR